MRRDIWIFLFFIGVLLFSWPFLSIFKHSLPAYLFTIWLVFIILILIASTISKREDSGG